MHKDEIEGTAKQISGSIKDAVGKVIGDEKLRAEGAAEKAEGAVQKKVGETKKAVRDALD